jgi:hypothetical protein
MFQKESNEFMESVLGELGFIFIWVIKKYWRSENVVRKAKIMGSSTANPQLQNF